MLLPRSTAWLKMTFVPHAACHAFTLHVHVWEKLKRLCVLADISFSLFRPFGTILGKNCSVNHATHSLLRERKVKIGMGLILR